MPETKTNVMRILEANKIPYKGISYAHQENDDFTSGTKVARELGEDASLVYKTLAAAPSAKGKSSCYVFVIPVEAELDLKKAAKMVREKSLDMLPLRDLTRVTGYIRGGCSPIGMKKGYPTVIQKEAESLEYFFVSGGKIGVQVKLSPMDLAGLIHASFGDITAST